MTELYGYTTAEVAKAMSVSDRRIRAMKARIRQEIAEDKFLREIFP
jgi:DNA-directed RNA polymerase specialized sigma24 family protein